MAMKLEPKFKVLKRAGNLIKKVRLEEISIVRGEKADPDLVSYIEKGYTPEFKTLKKISNAIGRGLTKFFKRLK